MNWEKWDYFMEVIYWLSKWNYIFAVFHCTNYILTRNPIKNAHIPITETIKLEFAFIRIFRNFSITLLFSLHFSSLDVVGVLSKITGVFPLCGVCGALILRGDGGDEESDSIKDINVWRKNDHAMPFKCNVYSVLDSLIFSLQL